MVFFLICKIAGKFLKIKYHCAIFNFIRLNKSEIIKKFRPPTSTYEEFDSKQADINQSEYFSIQKSKNPSILNHYLNSSFSSITKDRFLDFNQDFYYVSASLKNQEINQSKNLPKGNNDSVGCLKACLRMETTKIQKKKEKARKEKPKEFCKIF